MRTQPRTTRPCQTCGRPLACRWADPVWACRACGAEWSQEDDPIYAPPALTYETSYLPPRVAALIADAEASEDPIVVETERSVDSFALTLARNGERFELRWKIGPSGWTLAHSTDGWRKKLGVSEIRFRLKLDQRGTVAGTRTS